MRARKIEGLKTRVGREHYSGRWWVRCTRLNHGGIQAGGAQRGRLSVGRCGTSRRSKDATERTAPGVRAA